MRSLSPLLASWSRRGLTLVGAAALALTTGCDFILGVPGVDRVVVSTTPADSMPAASTGQVNATVYGDKDKVLNSNTKISVGYASSNPSVATVNSSTGAITALTPGTTEISATARDKKGTITLKVTAERPVTVQATLPTLYMNQRVLLSIDAKGASGNSLGKRTVQVVSNNQNVVTVEGDNTTTGVFLRGVSVGTTSVTVTVEGVTTTVPVTVQPPQVTRVQAGLQNGTNAIIVGGQSQVVPVLFGPDNTAIGNAGQAISYTSSNQTVATVNPQTGVVTGVQKGTTQIIVTVAGFATPFSFTVTVTEKPARQVSIVNRAPFVRLGSNGTGVPSQRTAIAVDSSGNPIADKVIAYRSTDPSVFTVSSLGTVVGQKLGTALLIASADNGAAADTISLTVTPVPIAQIKVNPTQATINAGQTQQFTATLTDSLGVVVTGRPITWTSSNPVGMPVNASGLATGATTAGGTATITATADLVPGQGQIFNTATLVVTPTPIATIDVQPTTVEINLRNGSQTAVSVVPRSANGTALVGRASSIQATVDNPTVVSADGSGNIRAFTTGTAHITYQAYDVNGAPQGAPTTITVTVTVQ